jgi:hypothetical protein
VDRPRAGKFGYRSSAKCLNYHSQKCPQAVFGPTDSNGYGRRGRIQSRRNSRNREAVEIRHALGDDHYGRKIWDLREDEMPSRELFTRRRIRIKRYK